MSSTRGRSNPSSRPGRSGGNRQQRSRRNRQVIAVGAVVLALVVISAIAVLGQGGLTSAGGANGAAASGQLPAERHFLGSPQAKVTVTEWTDFQCPACQTFVLSREPDFVKQYVDTGKVKFVSRQFAFLGPESLAAGNAAECAADQSQAGFWQYRGLLFQSQGAENSGVFTPDKLKALAGQAKLDQTRFNACVDSGQFRAAVQTESQEAPKLGIRGTPTLMVDGQILNGALGLPTPNELKAAVDQALARKG